MEKQTEQDHPVYKKSKFQYERQVLKEVTQLEQHLVIHRHRLVQMLTLADKLCNKHVHVNDLLNILSKLNIQTSHATVEVLLNVLVVSDNGLVNYSQLLRGGILRRVREYFQQLASEPTYHEKFNPVDEESSIDDISTQLQLEKYNTPSSMSGRNGILADETREEELKQFTLLIDYCRDNGVILDWKLAEQGM